MLPIRDHNPSERIPWVTWGLIAINVLIHLFVTMTRPEDQDLYRLYADYAMVPRFVSSGDGYGGLVTSLFLHADIWHLGGNMLFLWIYGDNLEAALGRIGYLAFYLACGVAAGLAQWAAEPMTLTPTIGASGAIAGVMGGYLLLYPRARIDILIFLIIYIRVVPIQAWLVLSLWLGLQFFGVLGASTEAGGVAYWAHIGGFAAGLALMAPIWWLRGASALWERSDGHPPHPDAQYSHLRSTTLPQVRRDLKRRSPWG